MKITVEDVITKKYDRGSHERVFIAQQRGVPEKTIEKAIAEWRKRGAAEFEREERRRTRIESDRNEWQTLPRAELIGRYLALFSSEDRTLALWQSTTHEPPDVFWQVWVRDGYWNICDQMWPMRDIMLAELRKRAEQLSPIEFMGEADRDFYEGLPDPVVVYRGCGKRFVRGLPWTTCPDVAAYFGRGGRYGAPNLPVIARAEVAKRYVFFAMQERDESEVVLDPYKIRRLSLGAVPPKVPGRKR